MINASVSYVSYMYAISIICQGGHPLSSGGCPQILRQEGGQGLHGLPDGPGEPTKHREPPKVRIVGKSTFIGEWALCHICPHLTPVFHSP